MASDRRNRWLFLGMAILLAVGLPWYRDPARRPEIWWGLPDWVVVAILCFFAIACLNAAAWWGADWDDESEEPP